MLAFLKKFLTKYLLEVVPSVVATVVGAYIVTHYINAKPEDKSTPVPAMSATVSDPATKGAKVAADRAKPAEEVKASDRIDSAPSKSDTADAKPDAKPDTKPSDLKSEARIDSKADSKKPVPALRGSVTKDAAREPTLRDKAAKSQAPVETASAPASEDINELARQALDRVRVSEPARPAEPQLAQPAAQPQPRAVTPAMQAVAVPQTAPAAMQPLPPPVVVATPAADEPPAPRPNPAPSRETQARPVPPADIPPMDLQASIAQPQAQNTSVTDDVLSAAKSMFHAVVPQQQ